MDDKTPPMDVNEGRVIAFVDIETDSLDATKIYVCCVKRTTDKQVQVYTDPDKFKKETTDIDKFIGHNIIDFDAPILDKLWGTNLTIDKLYDTLVLSQILSPQREGGNSLKAWGVRLGFDKLSFDIFDKFSEDYPKPKTVYLQTNYRSAGGIVDFCNLLIASGLNLLIV